MLQQWVIAGESVSIDSLAWGEFLCGPLATDDEFRARQLFPSPEPILTSDAELAARLFNVTGRRTRSFADCVIAATAIRVGARVATCNHSDFKPFLAHGLQLP